MDDCAFGGWGFVVEFVGDEVVPGVVPFDGGEVGDECDGCGGVEVGCQALPQDCFVEVAQMG